MPNSLVGIQLKQLIKKHHGYFILGFSQDIVGSKSFKYISCSYINEY